MDPCSRNDAEFRRKLAAETDRSLLTADPKTLTPVPEAQAKIADAQAHYTASRPYFSGDGEDLLVMALEYVWTKTIGGIVILTKRIEKT